MIALRLQIGQLQFHEQTRTDAVSRKRSSCACGMALMGFRKPPTFCLKAKATEPRLLVSGTQRLRSAPVREFTTKIRHSGMDSSFPEKPGGLAGLIQIGLRLKSNARKKKFVQRCGTLRMRRMAYRRHISLARWARSRSPNYSWLLRSHSSDSMNCRRR